MDRDQPRLGQLLGPGTDPPQMACVADGDQRETVLRSTDRRLFHRTKSDHLPVAEATVQQGHGAAVYHHSHRRIGHNFAPSEPVHVFRHTDHAVGIMTHKVRADQMHGHIPRFVLITSRRPEDRPNQRLKGGGRDQAGQDSAPCGWRITVPFSPASTPPSAER